MRVCVLDTLRAQAQYLPKTEIVPQFSHSLDISAVALSPDGALVLTGGKFDGWMKLWVSIGAEL